MEEELQKGAEQLKGEIIEGGLCISCGACVELCPYIKAVGDRVAVIHNCGLTDGNCYKVCPRTYTDYDFLAEKVTGDGPRDPALGGYRAIYRARAADKYSGPGQYGGVASALVAAALEGKQCDAALLTGSDGFYPKWRLARNEAEVIGAAGSKYGVCPGLSGLNQTMRTGAEKIAVVGRPCQVTALRKMQHLSTVIGSANLGLIFGLFCFWGLDYSFYRNIKQDRGVTQILHTDIPKDEGLHLKTDRGDITLDLEETRRFTREGCHSCIDPTSELADLSIGSTESDPGWCTLLVRTAAGVQLLDKAVGAGLIETGPYPQELHQALSEAVKNKKRRVLTGESEPGGPSITNSYIGLAEEVRNTLLGEGA